MADNSKKTPFGLSMQQFTQDKIMDAMQVSGKALPCSVVMVRGSIVKVTFKVSSVYTLPDTWMPMFGPTYIRYPMQVGDTGVALVGSVYMGGVSGLGGGTADLTQRGNLSTLVFLPISNTDWSGVDPNSVNINGPNGVVLRDVENNSTVVLSPTAITIMGKEEVTLMSGTSRLVVSSSGSVNWTDGSNESSIATMFAAWNYLIAWLITHTHVENGVGNNTNVPTQPYTGTNIAPVV